MALPATCGQWSQAKSHKTSQCPPRGKFTDVLGSLGHVDGICQVKFSVVDPSKGHGGHSRSPTVFLPITWEPNEIETWDCCHCVCLRKAHRMMYNLTYLGHRVTLPWLDLKSTFDLDLSRSNYTWFDAPWWEKHDGIKIVALPLKLKILSSKKRFEKNFEFWPLVTSILTWAKKWPKWFRNDFSRAF